MFFKSKNNPKESDSQNKNTANEIIDYEIAYTTHDFGLISVLKSVLSEAGITYFFQGENAAYLRAGIPVNLMIKKDQVEKAQEIIKEILK